MASERTPKKFPSTSCFPARRNRQGSYNNYKPIKEISLSGSSTPKSIIPNKTLLEEIELLVKEISPNFELNFNTSLGSSEVIQHLKLAITALKDQSSKRVLTQHIVEEGTINCEFCGCASANLYRKGEELDQKTRQFDKTSKNFENFKYIQMQKIREEKEIIAEMKYRLENLSNKLEKTRSQAVIDQKLQDSSRFSIENFQGIAANETSREISIEIFNVFHSGEQNMDFTSFIEELESHINIYNTEVIKKENELAARESQLIKRESLVQAKLNDLELMSLSLNNSSVELADLQYEVLPDLSLQSELVAHLVHELTTLRDDAFEYLEELKSRPKILSANDHLLTKAEDLYQENCKYSETLKKKQVEMDLYYKNKEKELKTLGDDVLILQNNANATIKLIEEKEKHLLAASEALRAKERQLNLTLGNLQSSRPTIDTLANLSPLKKYYHSRLNAKSLCDS